MWQQLLPTGSNLSSPTRTNASVLGGGKFGFGAQWPPAGIVFGGLHEMLGCEKLSAERKGIMTAGRWTVWVTRVGETLKLFSCRFHTGLSWTAALAGPVCGRFKCEAEAKILLKLHLRKCGAGIWFDFYIKSVIEVDVGSRRQTNPNIYTVKLIGCWSNTIF